MGAMRKMAVYLGLVEDSGSYDEEPDDYDRAVQRRQDESAASTRAAVAPRPADDSRYAAVREVRPVARTERSAPRPEPTERIARVDLREPVGDVTMLDSDDPASDSYRITTLHPRSYNDARRIGEEFRAGTPVIINLTEMGDGDAKRIVDFAAGLVFALHGSIERVTNKVFLLSPNNVDVAAEARRLAQDGFFNQS